MPISTDTLRACPVRHLGDVAAIRLGFTPLKERRGELSAPEVDGPGFVRDTVLVVHPSHVKDDGSLDWPRLERANVPPHQSYDGHILVPPSILLCLRGVMRVASLDAKALSHDLDATVDPLPVVASGAWAVLCPRPDTVLPQYLAWFLKLPSTMKHLLHARTGTVAQFVPISAVQGLELPLPPLDAQAAFVRAAALMDQMEQLERQRLDLLRQCLAGTISTHRSSKGVVRRRGASATGKPTD
jgi:hypothetical protein